MEIDCPVKDFRPEQCPEMPEILKSVLKCPEIHIVLIFLKICPEILKL